MRKSPHILVTNDDGIDSDGLIALAHAMRDHGSVTIVAPDGEYSGAGAAIGPIWQDRPEVHERSIDGIERAYAVSGPPALCVLYARLNAFGFRPDLIVSGINPGANVGRSVYHSGTVGACFTGRTGGISGVAVSQAVPNFGVEGQAWGDVVSDIDWSPASQIASAAVGALLASSQSPVGVLNINVPAADLAEIKGCSWTEVGMTPARAMVGVELSPKPGHHGSFTAEYVMGDAQTLVEGTDVEAVANGRVSLTWLGPIVADSLEMPHLDEALAACLG